MDLVVTSVVNQLARGVIFGAEDARGAKFRVLVNNQAMFPTAGETYRVEGIEGEYLDQYGRSHRQIEASFIRRVKTSGYLLRAFLTRLTGVGQSRARKIVDAFGSDLERVLSNPDCLEKLAMVIQGDRPALGRKIAAMVQAEYRGLDIAEGVVEREYEFYAKLDSLGMNDLRVAKTLWRLLGQSSSADAIMDNPYLAAALVNWNHADDFGLRVLRAKGVSNPERHEERYLGAVDAATKKLLKSGNTIASLAEWKRLAPTGINRAKMIEHGLRSGKLVAARSGLRPAAARFLEDGLSEMLRQIHENGRRWSDHEISAALTFARNKISFDLTDEQIVSVQEILSRPLSCLQGGAGVGKTTVMAAVTHAWEYLGGNILFAALSGKAALQLTKAVSERDQHRSATTITRLLLILKDFGAGKPVEGLGQVNECTMIVLDEASMIDTATLFDLLEELRKHGSVRLLLVGDAHQLPPIGFGAAYHRLVAVNVITSHLTHPLRQADGSSIPGVASVIRSGAVPQIEAYSGQAEGVQFSAASKEHLLDVLEARYFDLRHRWNTDDIMVAAGKNKTVKLFNDRVIAPNYEDAKRLGIHATVYPGDPVICTRNHYKFGVVNGQLGRVTKIHPEIEITWDGEDPLSSRSVPPEMSLDVSL
ncbi:ATP-dependent RecD-like DNA helicase [Leisingera daeponensis]|uniref:ATP-dependent DNA helicase n=1 Tax=Leisingera daeponensis TaxID=405746 RepID=UPI001C9484EB|nr:AAA family ATPase [Leisingera daeponensis]MBY6058170.1 AAA family ATPase [Leisingera daeponensis]